MRTLDIFLLTFSLLWVVNTFGAEIRYTLSRSLPDVSESNIMDKFPIFLAESRLK